MENFEKMFGCVIKYGNSLGFTIPINNVKFSGIEEGDILEIWYKKKREFKD